MAKLSDYFNSTTNRGRANVAKATYATIALIFIYARFIRKKTPKQPNQPETAAALPPHSHTPDDGSMASKGESTCPKCQCGCQCQFINEAGANSDTNDGHQNTTNTEQKSAQETPPTQHTSTHNEQNHNNTKISDDKVPTPKILKEIDIEEVLTYENDKAFTEFDPW